MNDDQAVEDKQLLHSAKAFGGTMGRDLLELIERQDTEIKKLKADLDKVVNALVKS